MAPSLQKEQKWKRAFAKLQFKIQKHNPNNTLLHKIVRFHASKNHIPILAKFRFLPEVLKTGPQWQLRDQKPPPQTSPYPYPPYDGRQGQTLLYVQPYDHNLYSCDSPIYNKLHMWVPIRHLQQSLLVAAGKEPPKFDVRVKEIQKYVEFHTSTYYITRIDPFTELPCTTDYEWHHRKLDVELRVEELVYNLQYRLNISTTDLFEHFGSPELSEDLHFNQNPYDSNDDDQAL